jgi:hypothetical protein
MAIGVFDFGYSITKFEDQGNTFPGIPPSVVSTIQVVITIRGVPSLCQLREIQYPNTGRRRRYEGSFPVCMLTCAFVLVCKDNDVASSKMAPKEGPPKRPNSYGYSLPGCFGDYLTPRWTAIL